MGQLVSELVAHRNEKLRHLATRCTRLDTSSGGRQIKRRRPPSRQNNTKTHKQNNCEISLKRNEERESTFSRDWPAKTLFSRLPREEKTGVKVGHLCRQLGAVPYNRLITATRCRDPLSPSAQRTAISIDT